MIFNGKQYLPLEEAVQQLINLVERHYEVDRIIADFGITVVNQPIQNPSYLEGVRGTQWGEAYPVGYSSPYDIYIWTRPTASTTNVADGTWFNVGPLAIPGPQGPRGEQGEQGERGHSTRWYFGDTVTEVSSPNPGDIFMNRDGVLFMYDDVSGWGLPIISIRGPQGPQGPQGRQGPQGAQGPQGPQGPIGESLPAIVLIGKLTSVDLLPAPSASYVGRGYIVTTGDINSVYTVFEDESQSGQYTWNIAGTISGFSVITSGGVVLPQFNSDTKVDKVTTSGVTRAYTIGANGQQTTTTVDFDSAIPNSIVGRTSNGTIRTEPPIVDQDVTNRKYVDDGLAGKLNIRTETSEYPQLYEKSSSGNNQLRYLSSTWQDDPEIFTTVYFKYSAAQRDEYGCIQVGDPRKSIDAVSKRYAETHFAPKLYRHTCLMTGYAYYDGVQWDMQCVFEFVCSAASAVGTFPTATQILNAMAGTSASSTAFVAHGKMYNSTAGENNIAYVTASRSPNVFTVYNLYNEVIAVMDFENGSLIDIVSPVA